MGGMDGLSVQAVVIEDNGDETSTMTIRFKGDRPDFGVLFEFSLDGFMEEFFKMSDFREMMVKVEDSATIIPNSPEPA